MTSKFWCVVVTDCTEWNLSSFWSTSFKCGFFVFILCSSLPQTVNGARGKICWSNPSERTEGSKFHNIFWRHLWPEGAPNDSIYEWSQMKFKDEALRLHFKKSFCSGGLKKLPRIAGRSFSP